MSSIITRMGGLKIGGPNRITFNGVDVTAIVTDCKMFYDPTYGADQVQLNMRVTDQMRAAEADPSPPQVQKQAHIIKRWNWCIDCSNFVRPGHFPNVHDVRPLLYGDK